MDSSRQWTYPILKMKINLRSSMLLTAGKLSLSSDMAETDGNFECRDFHNPYF